MTSLVDILQDKFVITNFFVNKYVKQNYRLNFFYDASFFIKKLDMRRLCSCEGVGDKSTIFIIKTKIICVTSVCNCNNYDTVACNGKVIQLHFLHVDTNCTQYTLVALCTMLSQTLRDRNLRQRIVMKPRIRNPIFMNENRYFY